MAGACNADVGGAIDVFSAMMMNKRSLQALGFYAPGPPTKQLRSARENLDFPTNLLGFSDDFRVFLPAFFGV